MDADIAILGEVMLELSPLPEASDKPSSSLERYDLGVAGDSYNTAAAISLLGGRVEYVTALGEERYSERILNNASTLSIGTHAIMQEQGLLPGLYMIHNDRDGERHFTYWRDQSAARQKFASAEGLATLLEPLTDVARIFLSGITLALCSDASREVLFQWLDAYRCTGGQVSFDSNYRPILWTSREHALEARERMLARTDMFLPSIDDEMILLGTTDKEKAIRILADSGIGEIVVKSGADPVTLIFEGERSLHAIRQSVTAVDTTGAGDAFNGAYIAARLAGCSPKWCTEFAATVAGQSVMMRGAIMPLPQWRTSAVRLQSLSAGTI